MVDTKIGWCDHTVNLWWGCAKVHSGCKNCYAETLSHRWGNNVWGADTERKVITSAFRTLDKLQRKAANLNIRQTVFVGSMMDIFENSKPIIDNKGNKVVGTQGNGSVFILETADLRVRLFNKIQSKEYSNLIFLFLTKRPDMILYLIPNSWKKNPPKNVWFGTSVSTQSTANEYIPRLIENTPKKSKRFLSVEPQLEYINLFENSDSMENINWVIQGCESGKNRRKFDLDWAYTMRMDCKLSGIPYFLKQIPINNKIETQLKNFPEILQVQEFPNNFKMKTVHP